jgi:hypothetical protein
MEWAFIVLQTSGSTSAIAIIGEKTTRSDPDHEFSQASSSVAERLGGLGDLSERSLTHIVIDRVELLGRGVRMLDHGVDPAGDGHELSMAQGDVIDVARSHVRYVGCALCGHRIRSLPIAEAYAPDDCRFGLSNNDRSGFGRWSLEEAAA